MGGLGSLGIMIAAPAGIAVPRVAALSKRPTGVNGLRAEPRTIPGAGLADPRTTLRALAPMSTFPPAKGGVAQAPDDGPITT